VPGGKLGPPYSPPRQGRARLRRGYDIGAKQALDAIKASTCSDVRNEE
jgi:hypothetical protein